MKVDITLAEADILRVHVRGEETYDNTVSYWRQIAQALALPGRDVSRLLLVDELQGEPLTEQQWLQLVVSMDGTGIGGLRIAHTKPLGLQEIEYCEVFARDAGMDSRVFADESSALDWLRKD